MILRVLVYNFEEAKSRSSPHIEDWNYILQDHLAEELFSLLELSLGCSHKRHTRGKEALKLELTVHILVDGTKFCYIPLLSPLLVLALVTSAIMGLRLKYLVEVSTFHWHGLSP